MERILKPETDCHGGFAVKRTDGDRHQPLSQFPLIWRLVGQDHRDRSMEFDRELYEQSIFDLPIKAARIVKATGYCKPLGSPTNTVNPELMLVEIEDLLSTLGVLTLYAGSLLQSKSEQTTEERE